MGYTILKLKKQGKNVKTDHEAHPKGRAYQKGFGVTNRESFGLTASATAQASEGGMRAAAAAREARAAREATHALSAAHAAAPHALSAAIAAIATARPTAAVSTATAAHATASYAAALRFASSSVRRSAAAAPVHPLRSTAAPTTWSDARAERAKSEQSNADKQRNSAVEEHRKASVMQIEWENWAKTTQKSINEIFEDDQLVKAAQKATLEAADLSVKGWKLARTIWDKATNLCCICYEKAATIAFIPCGHFGTCNTCAIRVNTCPFCRKEITEKILIRT